ncbi:MAG: branched-chain amino acid ABC transporter permease [Xanthobacteraceae bacterium]|jgi:branched-chain amino acid transport system permease protein
MDSPIVRKAGYALILVLAMLPPLFLGLGEPFYLDVVARMMIFGIAALSLDLLLGYSGMISLGHAVYLGIGGYAIGILNYYGINDGALQFGAAVLFSALAAFFIGAVSLRTSGVFFLMITLAFSQMLYFLAISINTFGGDDGLTISQPSDLGLNLRESSVFYYFVLAALAALLIICDRIVNSRFGMLIRGIKYNESRMVAIGFPTFRYKLTAFVIAGAICGFAGALLANQTLFVSPSLIHWSRSGELLVMVIAGGVSTLVGPVIGAILYLLLEKVLSGWTIYWGACVGISLVLLVLAGKRGVLGLAIRKAGVSHA